MNWVSISPTSHGVSEPRNEPRDRRGAPWVLVTKLPVEDRREELCDQSLVIRLEPLGIDRLVRLRVQIIRIERSDSIQRSLIFLVA